jgi:Putative adhesin
VQTTMRNRPCQSHSRWPVKAATSFLLLLAAILFSSPNSSAGEIDKLFKQTYPLPPGGSFLLDNVNGSVQVDGWERDEVEVTAVKTSQSDQHDVELVKIEVDSTPGKIAVHTRYPKGEGAEVAVEYHVHVPYRILLGSVETVNGSVIVRGVDGSGALRSVNGNVEVTNSTGRFSEKTTNGNVRLELRQLSDGGPMNLETVNGSVVLGLPTSARADLKVLSMNGDVTSDLPVTSTAGSPGARAYQAKLGVGGGQISVRTINGGIRLFLQRPGV